MKTSKFLLLLAGLSLISLAGAGCGQGEGRQVLARIDKGKIITLADFNGRISKLPKRYQDAVNKNKKIFLEELVMDELLYKEALRKKLYEDRDVQNIFKEAKKKILIARLLKDEVEDKATVGEKDIEEYYNENKDEFMTPEVLRASHILVKKEEDAKEILTQLSNNKNFEDLAKTYSIDPAAKNGGDIGYFTRRQILPELEEVCFKMKVGEVSGIVKTRFGYHIIKLTERNEPKLEGLDEVREKIEQALKRHAQKMRFNEFVKSLKDNSKIYINDVLLEKISEKEDKEETLPEKPES